MKTPPAELDPTLLAAALADGWGLPDVRLTYRPLGFGSHHWLAEDTSNGRWFVTVDDLRGHHLSESTDAAFSLLETALRAVVTLRDVSGLSFVVAPLTTPSGEVVMPVGAGFAMAVYPFLSVEPSDFGAFRQLSDRNEALNLVGRVHRATTGDVAAVLRQDTLTIPGRAGLLRTLGDLDASWKGGPHSEPARRLVREHAATIASKFDRFDRLARAVGSDPSAWVITHGEPHAGNVIRTHAGELVMVDWDTVALAPRERDLWMMLGDGNPDWSAYREVTGVGSLSPDAMDAYRLHWDLSEIAIYVDWCRRPHEQTEEMAIAWEGLNECILR